MLMHKSREATDNAFREAALSLAAECATHIDEAKSEEKDTDSSDASAVVVVLDLKTENTTQAYLSSLHERTPLTQQARWTQAQNALNALSKKNPSEADASCIITALPYAKAISLDKTDPLQSAMNNFFENHSRLTRLLTESEAHYITLTSVYTGAGARR